MNYKILQWSLPIFSGIFLILSYPPFSLKFLPFFSLLPLFFFLNLKGVSLKRAFLAGLITGLIFLAGVIWPFDLLPLDYIGIENNLLGFFILFFSWLLFLPVFASFFGLFSLSYHFLKQRNCRDILLVPSLWIIFEYFRAWSFGIFLAGKETLFGPHWTLGNLAYTVAPNSNLMFLASIGGIYLVSFLIVLFNGLFFFLFSHLNFKNKELKFPYFLAILVISSLISFSYFSFFSSKEAEKAQTLKVAILQTKFPSFFHQTKEQLKEKFQIQTQLLGNVSQSPFNLDIIVFPEDSRFLKQKNSKEILAAINPQKEILLIDSSRTETSEGIKSIATFYNTQKGTLAHYEKLLLAPAGEYLPYIFQLPAQIINRKWVKEFEKSRGYKKGKEIVIFSGDGWQGSTLFCSEIFSPNLHRQIAKKDTQILFNLGSLAFSRGSKILDSQAQAVLQFRAAENGRYLVRATNYGSSYIINQKGEIVKKSSDFENQVIFGEINPISEKTFYAKFGDWILIFAFGIISFSIIRKFDIFKRV